MEQRLVVGRIVPRLDRRNLDYSKELTLGRFGVFSIRFGLRFYVPLPEIMVTRRVIKSALRSFLDTYVSRYSDYEGYWLFGFLVGDLREVRIDLLAPAVSDPETPQGAAISSAAAKFVDQLRKAGLARSDVREAWLTIRRLTGSIEGSVNGHACTGHNLCFVAEAVMEGGRRYEREAMAFVAPHNAKIEFRSMPFSEPDGAPGCDGE